MHNKSLLFKWLWRYSKESDDIWQQVLDAIYGAKVGWKQISSQLKSGGGTWKMISDW